MPWLTNTLGSVAFFVSGMLCLVKAQRNNDYNSRVHIHDVGSAANLALGFVGAALASAAVGSAAAFGTPRVGRDFLALLRDTDVAPWVAAFSVLFFVGNALFFKGLVQAPNAGYARAVMSVEVVFVTVCSAWLFGDSLSAVTLFGTVLAVAGIAIVAAAS